MEDHPLFKIMVRQDSTLQIPQALGTNPVLSFIHLFFSIDDWASSRILRKLIKTILEELYFRDKESNV